MDGDKYEWENQFIQILPDTEDALEKSLKKIVEINNINIDLQPIPTTSYPTPAQRPKYSVLDKSKIKTVFGIEIKTWEDSLKTVVI